MTIEITDTETGAPPVVKTDVATRQDDVRTFDGGADSAATTNTGTTNTANTANSPRGTAFDGGAGPRPQSEARRVPAEVLLGNGSRRD